MKKRKYTSENINFVKHAIIVLGDLYSFSVTCDQCFRSSLKAIPSIMMNKMEVVLVMVYRATVTNLRLHWLRPMSQEEATPTGATLEM